MAERTEKTNLFRQESLERLSSPEQLDQLMQIVRPQHWIPLVMLAVLVSLGVLWSIVARIPQVVSGPGVLLQPSESDESLVGLSYLGRIDGSKVRPGMDVLILPSTGSDRQGGIIGRVEEITVPSTTTLGMARKMDSMDEAVALSEVEVLVIPEADSETASGYRWSSASGADQAILPGTAATMQITLDEQPPIAFVFPFLKQ
ncbi:MAG: hypothetical protein AAF289_12675 [Cyanobacteria bacterium P01_A01_bin.135]